MTNLVSSINNSGQTNAQTSTNASLAALQKNPDSFKLYMAQLMNNNIGAMTAMASPLSDQTSSSSTDLFGLPTSTGSDPLQALGNFSGAVSTDPTQSLMNSQGLSQDFSWLMPAPNLGSIQLNQSLQELAKYSNITETQKWLGQSVTYLDPNDKQTKTGTVVQVNIENETQPLFKLDTGVEVTQESLLSLNLKKGA